MKETNKHVFKILGLIFIYFILNLLILPYVLNKKYHFLGSFLPYFYDPDSYFYLAKFNIPIAYLLAIVLPIITIILFYCVCTKVLSSKYSFLSSFGLMTFPYFFSQTYIANFDMQKFTLMLFLVIFGSILNFSSNKKKSLILILISLFIITLAWTGFPIILACVLFGLIYGVIKGWKRWFILVISGSVGFLLFKNKFFALIILKGLHVAEYLTPRYVLYYFIFFLMTFWYFVYYENKDNESKILFGSSLFMFSLSLFIGRFTLFAIVLMFLLLVKTEIFNNKFWRIATILMIIFNIFTMYVSYNDTFPQIDQSEELFLTNCFNESYPVLSFWDNGHIIEYFTKNQAIFKANPIYPYDREYNTGISTGNITSLDSLASKPYYLYLKDADAQKLAWHEYDNDLVYEIIKSGKMNGFETICHEKDKVLLLRK